MRDIKMKFINYIENKNIITEAMEEAILTEGWGFTLSLLVPVLNIRNLLKTGRFAEINKNKNFVKYVNKMAQKVLAKEKRSNPNLILIKQFTKADREANSFLDDMKMGDDTIKDKLGHWQANMFCGDCIIRVYADTEHIEKIKVAIQDKTTRKVHYSTLPAPDKQELKDLGWRPEEEHNK